MSVLAKIRTALFRNVVVNATYLYYTKLYGMDFGKCVNISLKARLDKTNPKGIHIGDYTAVTNGAAVLTHDFVHREWKETRIGSNCFIWFNAVILPGVTVGDGCIISANSVVVRDIPPHSVAMGNPAKVVERDIVTGAWGVRLDKGNDTPVEILGWRV